MKDEPVIHKVLLILFCILLYGIWTFVGTEISEFLYY